jgi:AcrR family transcriptional regulator
MPPTATAPHNRKGQIVEAARLLFVRHGYRRNSMDDIAAEAGLAKRTLYLHFESKETIFRAMLDACQLTVRTRASAAEQLDAPLAERLADLLYAYFGTALEWFGDGSHLREIETLVGDDPVAFGARHMCDELSARAVSMLQQATRACPGSALAEQIKSRGEVAVLATIGAKSLPDATAVSLRRSVHAIARRLCDGLDQPEHLEATQAVADSRRTSET